MKYQAKKKYTVLDVIEIDDHQKQIARAEKFPISRQRELELQEAWLLKNNPKVIPERKQKSEKTLMYIHKEILNTAPIESKCQSCPWAECPDTVAKRNKCGWCIAEYAQGLLELWE